ncbi:hypothetical protein BKA67DRAFT_655744 [Truncatella angustata]|uniref:F-box domain-containing protein n=1 Tax=Truncatella angustata TaxID=152316 RepID=A0A9P8UR57_9PEZI|nr:uncharacterized protein BKA67DRAFT_655744 [Truncatella angustata]KAH6657475.1 hypothetical protein BKA67DRAFT_655744 [Truncatella angustata]
MAATVDSTRPASQVDSLASASLPVRAVLRTPELLELVLLPISQRALLTSVQRVNHWFHDVISASPRLQTYLFFRPRQPIHWDTVEINHLVADLLPESFNPSALLMRSRRFCWVPNAPRELHILQCQCVTHLETNSCPSGEETEEEAGQCDPDSSWCRPEASWRKMLVLQPTKSAKGELPPRRYRISVEPLPPNAFLFGHQSLVMGQLLSQARQKSNEDIYVVLVLLCNGAGKTTPLHIFLTKRTIRGGSDVIYLVANFPRAKSHEIGTETTSIEI